MKSTIKIISAALDEFTQVVDGKKKQSIILRGVIDPSSFPLLKVDPRYQRGVETPAYIRKVMQAFRTHGGCPDVDLGMRGHSFSEPGGDFFLHDDVYIVDGQQRLTAAKRIMEEGIVPRVGAAIHFDTYYEWEKARFEALNQQKVNVHANILIRNRADENAAIKMLIDLGKDSSYVLHNRVCWGQKMNNEHLLHGKALLNTIGNLHRRFAPQAASSRHAEACVALDRLMARIGRTRFRDNIKTFWNAVDSIFHVRDIQIVSAAPYLKQGFLKAFSRVLSDHQDFWKDTELVIPTAIIQKMRSFPLSDPNINMLFGNTGKGQSTLTYHIIEHMNKCKRLYRLRPFNTVPLPEDEPEDGLDGLDNLESSPIPLALLVASTASKRPNQAAR
jgi:hypothetical protein